MNVLAHVYDQETLTHIFTSALCCMTALCYLLDIVTYTVKPETANMQGSILTQVLHCESAQALVKSGMQAAH